MACPLPTLPPPPAFSDFGSPLEIEKNGMLRATFVGEGKLDELEMMFDGIAVHQQLQKAMGVSEPSQAKGCGYIHTRVAVIRAFRTLS